MNLSVILVEPEGEENVGMIARAMKNFSVSNLIMVNPKATQSMAMRSRAMHSWDIIENSTTVKSFEDAIRNFDFVVAASAKVFDGRNTTRKFFTVREMVDNLAGVDGSIALVIGREPSGLSNTELRRCDAVVHIPTNIDHKSLNISHAVAILLYELSNLNEAGNTRKLDRKEFDHFLKEFEAIASDPALKLRNPENSVKCFRNVLGRSFVSNVEIKGIRSVISTLYSAFKGAQKL